ncbi:MAG: hypothetical protein F6K42_28800 [Leptolyngbya sp. SIO1D8]|nr:hypothetical protein [Leptolyngbya sp. SIO1D8]
MLPKFIESLSGKLAERWTATVLAPAFAFWLGGLVLRATKLGWQDPVDFFKALTNYEQLGVLIGGLLLITISGTVIQRFDLAILRFLQGYWGLPLKPLTNRLKQLAYQHTLKQQDQFQRLTQFPIHSLKPEQRNRLLQLDWQLAHRPTQEHLTMPTCLGNLLRAAEQKSYDRYGLDTLVCWPRLWLLLPDSAKKELETARDNLNTNVRIWLWCLLFILWSFWNPWIIPIALVAASFVYYQWILPAAALYADLLEATFDLYRMELYKALRWPLPQSPAEEKSLGLQLTAYLWRGSDESQPQFLPVDNK